MAMDDLIRFVTDASGAMIAVLAMIGFIALIGGIGVILHMEMKDMREDEDGEA